ncbi:MAG TPA: hypothetical protein VMY15_01275, partial [Candidatus Latescibacteria bacterium]|nr:hypothetical protein [Candidatus Latescibacterota bacterium]
MGMDRQIDKKKWPPRKIAAVASVAAFVLILLYLFLFQFNKSTLNVEAERITISCSVLPSSSLLDSCKFHALTLKRPSAGPFPGSAN